MSYTYAPHSPAKRKNMPWHVCRNCGLVYLNNAFTAWAIKVGCNNNEHPDIDAMRHKFTGRSV